MPIYAASSDSEDDRNSHNRTKLFTRQRSLHAIFGGGKIADILLWRDAKTAATLLIGVSLLWFLLQVVEYNFITLICHISITSILILFIWSSTSDFFNWERRPMIPRIVLDESYFNKLAKRFHVKFNQIISKLLDIAYGKDPPLFFITTISLYVLSIIGTYFSFINLMFIGIVSMQTLPVLYEMYEDDVDRMAGKLRRKMKKVYRKVDTKVISKIPRGTVKSKKFT